MVDFDHEMVTFTDLLNWIELLNDMQSCFVKIRFTYILEEKCD